MRKALVTYEAAQELRDQGLQVQFSAGTLVQGQTFAVKTYVPTVQAAQDVERVMFKAGERPSRKEEVDRDAIGHRVGHCRDASGRKRRLPAP